MSATVKEVTAITSPAPTRTALRKRLSEALSSARRRPCAALLAGTILLAAAATHADPPSAAPTTAPAVTVSRVEAKLPALKPPSVNCASAILVDAISGKVLYEMNADAERPMASTTKIMTALLFCESVPDEAVITASDKACRVRDSSLHLKHGEQLKAHDLLRAILMRSANDGCVAAAEYAAGSEAAFVERMNERAVQLGALHTHFMNPHGLHNPRHYTTARDLAVIARAAMQVPRIEEVVRCEKVRIKRSMDKDDVTMRNHSHFLGHFPGADGVKTGWTIPAGHCYVGSATIGGWRLISVVLKSKNYVQDTAALMKYGFHNFEPNTVARAGDVVGSCPLSGGTLLTVPATVRQTVQIVTRKGANPQITKRMSFAQVTAPVDAGKQIGTLDVSMAGGPSTEVPLIAAAAVPASPLQISRSGGPWKGFGMTATIFCVGLVSLGYGTRYRTRIAAIAKGAGKRRRSLAQKLRDPDSGG
jgi:serine-type D-Ala-D-Ala carboxypeptidase (penicillin-binding protein 5/6)